MYVSILQDSHEVIALCEQHDCGVSLNFNNEIEVIIGKSTTALYFCSESCIDAWIFDSLHDYLAVNYS